MYVNVFFCDKIQRSEFIRFIYYYMTVCTSVSHLSVLTERRLVTRPHRKAVGDSTETLAYQGTGEQRQQVINRDLNQLRTPDETRV